MSATLRHDPPRSPPVEDDLRIPMTGPPPVVYAVGAVVVVVLIGAGLFALAGRSGGKRPAERPAAVAAESAATPPIDARTQSEHLAMTQRALAAVEEKKQEQEAASAAVASQSAAPPPAAPPRAGVAQRPPAASDIDSLGDDIAAKLQ
jgi:hypothetical protein